MIKISVLIMMLQVMMAVRTKVNNAQMKILLIYFFFNNSPKVYY